MEKTRIAVLVSGGGTNLEALLCAKENGKIPHGDICLVVSSKQGVFALERAKNHNVKSVVIEQKDKELFENELISTLQNEKIDLVVLAGFLKILTERFTKLYSNRIINVHPSLIPSFCGNGFYGLTVHEKALDYGVKVTGATVHFVNEIPDGGKIILQKSVNVCKNDTPEKLQKRVMKQAEWVILPKAVELVSKNLTKEKNKK